MNPHCPIVCPDGASAYVLADGISSALRLCGYGTGTDDPRYDCARLVADPAIVYCVTPLEYISVIPEA